jgi:hypothetical protein
MTNDEAASFLTQFNEIINSGDLTEDQEAQFSQLVAAMSKDPTNRENWEKIVTMLEESGLDISTTVG